jgi:SAM-dependent methyltransferase
MSELPEGVAEHVAHVFGQRDEKPEVYATRRATDLFEPFGPDCRGLGARRPTEIGQLLDGRPHKYRFVTAEQLRAAGPDGVETIEGSRARRRDRHRHQDQVQRHVYSQVAAGVGTEYGFRRGRALAEVVGYEPDDLAAVPSDTLDRFVGLGCPWSLGPAQPGWCCVDVGCGVGVDVFVAAGRAGPTGRVIGVDLSPGMVRAVTDAAIAAEVTQVRAIEGSATALPLAGGASDLVTANGLLVLVRDLRAALVEIRRVLRPGGLLRFADTVFGAEHSSRDADDLAYWNRLGHGRPFIAEVERQLVDAGFVDVRVGPQVDPFDPALDHSDVWGRSFEARRPA